jgi:hypothetical protein
MKIIQNKEDGSADIVFSWKEIWTLIKKRKLHLSADGLRHLGNHLIHIVSEFQMYFDEKTQNKTTNKDTDIKSE